MQPYTLIGLDIEGDWNKPLLANAAALSGCGCVFATAIDPKTVVAGVQLSEKIPLASALQSCRRMIACETARSARSVFQFPAPRESAAIVVGNEERGVPRRVLGQADAVIRVPLLPATLSSVNVAVAAAISLYALTHDLGRRRWRRSALRRPDVDILVDAPPDSHELGSLLRSLYAFGWRRVFLSDPHQVWFSHDPRVVLESRAAARRAKNLLAVLPSEKLNPSHYDAALRCTGDRGGTPLSRLRLPECRRLLAVLAPNRGTSDLGLPELAVTVDYIDPSVPARFRHTGSIFLSVVSELLVA